MVLRSRETSPNAEFPKCLNFGPPSFQNCEEYISVIYKLSRLSNFIIASPPDSDSYLEGVHFWQVHNGRDVVPTGYCVRKHVVSVALYDVKVVVASFLSCKVSPPPPAINK